MNTVNSFVAGMNQIREEIRVLRRIRISPPNDQFEAIMEVSFGDKKRNLAIVTFGHCKKACRLNMSLRIQKFVEDSEEGIQQILAIGQQLEQDLKQLLIFYGEDPVNTKPEDFFGMIVSFSSMLQVKTSQKCRIEKHVILHLCIDFLFGLFPSH